MKHRVTLTITSLFSILLMTLHLSDDIVRGMEPGGLRNPGGVLILVVWLYGALVLPERRSGYIIGSLLASAVPDVHMRGLGLLGVAIADTSGVSFWVRTLSARRELQLFGHLLGARTLGSASGPADDSWGPRL